MAAWYCWCLLIHLAVTDSGVLYWNISLSTRNTSLKKSGFCQNVSSCTNMNIIAVSSIISSSFLRLSDSSVLPCWWAVLLNEREKNIQLAKVHGNHIKNGKCPKIMVWHQPKQYHRFALVWFPQIWVPFNDSWCEYTKKKKRNGTLKTVTLFSHCI